MRNYSAEEVMQYVSEMEVKFIRLAFCDIFGRQKNIAILPSELPKAFSTGIAFDASAIAGFGGAVRSDLFLHPDPTTLVALPWRPEIGSVVRMFCQVTYPDGTPLPSDSRAILKKAVAEAEAKGYSFAFGSEMEFYLFQTDEHGNPTKEPYDRAGYMDIAPADKGENVRREVCLMLEQMGIQPESSHHEEGHGQNEVDFRYSDPVTAADNAVTFCAVVRTVADRNGLCADFSPKPLPDQPGSGMHINFSVKSKDGRDVIRYYAKNSGHHLILKPLPQLLRPAGGQQGARLHLLVVGEPLPAHPHSGSRRRISSGGAALAGLHRQPLPGLRRPHLRRSPRHRMGAAPARTGRCEPANGIP